jgi:tetratricopeptide (TPR) repeat protein
VKEEKRTEDNWVMRLLGVVFHVKTILVTGALLLMASSVLGWIDRPVLGWLIGFRMPISERLPAMLSYGLFCLGAGVLSLVALMDRFRWVCVVTSGVALLLSLNFLLSYSIFNAKEIILVNELNQQEARIVLFSNKNLPTCFMVNPTFDPVITTDTIKDRLYATIHFSTFGWYSAVLGGLLIIVAFCKLNGPIRYRNTAVIFIISALSIYVIVVVIPFLIAENYRNKGDYYLGTGMYYEALGEYEKYMNIDLSSKYIKSFHNHIGKIYYFIGRSDMADAYLYKGSVYMEQGNYPMAIFYYSNMERDDLSLMSPAARSFLVYAYVRYGLSEYQENMKDSSIEAWKRSLKINPSQVEAYYYLSRAYYDMSSFEESVLSGMQFLKTSRNRIRNAEVSCNIGDSFHKMKKFDQARLFYLKSLDFVTDGNQRALMSLLGR